MTLQPSTTRRGADSLADVLERVLDKGVVIAGDIVVNVLDIELLTLKLRLFISSAETAKEMGMDWWTNDPFFSGDSRRQATEMEGRQESEAGRLRALEAENEELRQRLAALERDPAPERAPAPELAAQPEPRDMPEADHNAEEPAGEPRRTDR